MSWQANAIMYWSSDGTNWNKISDHNRAPLDVSYERFGTDNRMVNATMRRHSVGKKRTFTASWDMFPSKETPSYGGKTGLGTVDGGWGGEQIENFYQTVDGRFYMKLRKGIDEAKAIEDGSLEVVEVMITDFSKSIIKRGIVDFWQLDITLEEV